MRTNPFAVGLIDVGDTVCVIVDRAPCSTDQSRGLIGRIGGSGAVILIGDKDHNKVGVGSQKLWLSLPLWDHTARVIVSVRLPVVNTALSEFIGVRATAREGKAHRLHTLLKRTPVSAEGGAASKLPLKLSFKRGALLTDAYIGVTESVDVFRADDRGGTRPDRLAVLCVQHKINIIT